MLLDISERTALLPALIALQTNAIKKVYAFSGAKVNSLVPSAIVSLILIIYRNFLFAFLSVISHFSKDKWQNVEKSMKSICLFSTSSIFCKSTMPFSKFTFLTGHLYTGIFVFVLSERQSKIKRLNRNSKYVFGLGICCHLSNSLS